MKQSIAVLTLTPQDKAPQRNGGSNLKGPGLEASSMSLTAPVAASVEILKDASAADLSEINRNPKTVGAPLMPLRLIAPLLADDPGGGGGIGGNIAWGVQAVGAPQSNATGKGITVAILDTGIQKDHPAFSGITEWVTQDFTGSGTNDVNDTHGHGTHCAGTIFGRDFNGMRIGVARGVTRVVIGKVLGGPQSGDSGKLAQAMQWAANQGASIISMSLGIDFPGYVESLAAQGMNVRPATSMALEAYRANVLLFEKLAAFFVAQAAFSQSVLVVAATGNESARYQSLNPYTINLSPPAAAPGILGVAAVGQYGQGFKVAGFSNTGGAIAGPGVNITSAWPGSILNSISGTSMATPHVAGVAALWAEKLSQQGNLSSESLRAQLLATATVASMTPGWTRDDIGNGLVQAPKVAA